MIKILLIDDNNDKIVKIIKSIRESVKSVHVETAIDFSGAQRLLLSTKFDLIIVDLFLPVRAGEIASMNVGKNLISEIIRNDAFQKPQYIMALSEFVTPGFSASNMWPTVKYTAENNAWCENLKEILKYITILVAQNMSDTTVLKNKIFVEGVSDQKVLSDALLLLRPDIFNNVEIVAETSAGASWVARQIIVWAHALNRNSAGHYIKAVGILDGDSAGKLAKEEIGRVIKNDSAESKTFKIFQLTMNYAKHLIPIKSKGLVLPVCLEEMFPSQHWQFAHDHGWMRLRNNPETLLKDPNSFNRYDISLKDYVDSLGLLSDEKLYLSYLAEEHKAKFVDYILSMKVDARIECYECYRHLIDDIGKYLS